jgi:hypothetical protein
MGYGQALGVGSSVDVPYNAADFSANQSMTWTVQAGDVNGFSYQIFGKRLFMTVDVINSSVGGVVANAFLQIKIPGGFTPRRIAQVPFTYQDAGGNPTSGYCIITSGSNILSFRPAVGANWSLSTDTTRVSFNGSFEVN